MDPVEQGQTVSRNVKVLLDRGVIVHAPWTVYVDDDIDPTRIAPGAVIHAGCRIWGASTSVGPGCELGEEAPATVRDCCLGHGVSLAGGSFSGSTFLDGVKVGSAAHVRPGTLLEEGASAAHCVGFKQTILLPFVTVGSLANFCDCLMAGGTGRRDHGEVGSSYIHFNFTPNQDKATASLLGDVPNGVMLDRPPVFLGGQGGLVGPARLAFGTVVAAGVVCRQDVLDEGMLYTGRAGNGGRVRRYQAGSYVGVGRVFRNNLIYIGNILALRAWYESARRHLMSGDPYREACRQQALSGLALVLEERLRRLGEVADAVGAQGPSVDGGCEEGRSTKVAVAAYTRLRDEWPRLMADVGGVTAGAGHRQQFLEAWVEIDPVSSYPEAVASLTESSKEAGRRWLRAIVDEIAGLLADAGRQHGAGSA